MKNAKEHEYEALCVLDQSPFGGHILPCGCLTVREWDRNEHLSGRCKRNLHVSLATSTGVASHCRSLAALAVDAHPGLPSECEPVGSASNHESSTLRFLRAALPVGRCIAVHDLHHPGLLRACRVRSGTPCNFSSAAL